MMGRWFYSVKGGEGSGDRPNHPFRGNQWTDGAGSWGGMSDEDTIVLNSRLAEFFEGRASRYTYENIENEFKPWAQADPKAAQDYMEREVKDAKSGRYRDFLGEGDPNSFPPAISNFMDEAYMEIGSMVNDIAAGNMPDFRMSEPFHGDQRTYLREAYAILNSVSNPATSPERDYPLYRGMYWGGKFDDIEVGDVIQDPVMSFSRDEQVAKNFATANADQPGGTTKVVLICNNAKALQTSSFRESEAFAGGKFKITKKDEKDGIIYLTIDHISRPPKPKLPWELKVKAGGRLPLESKIPVLKGGSGSGDVAGHRFHGNQWTGSISFDVEDDARDDIEKLADSSVRRVGEMSGAQPGSKVSISSAEDGVLHVEVEHRDYQATREMGVRSLRDFLGVNDDSEELTIYNMSFALTDSAKSGAGLGIFSDQVRAASKAGVQRIVTLAVGFHGDQYNGYYTWPRFGYNNVEKITLHDAREAPAGIPGVSAGSGVVVIEPGALRNVMASAAGRKWWERDGSEFIGVFDLRKGSDSRKVLAAYIKERKAAYLLERSRDKVVKGGPGSGDLPGHAFRGNQWTQAFSGGEALRQAFSGPLSFRDTVSDPARPNTFSEETTGDGVSEAGMPKTEAAKLAGAQGGSTVTFSAKRKGIASVEVQHNEYWAERQIGTVGCRAFLPGSWTKEESEPALTIYNENLKVFQGKGIGLGAGVGLRVFSSQVVEAAKAGVARIITIAGGDAHMVEYMNGYYTWPRMGYQNVGRVKTFAGAFDSFVDKNKDLFEIEPKRTPRGEEHTYLKDRSVQELMKRPGGADWWKKKGNGFVGIFDLKRGSESRKMLSAYIKERKAKMKARGEKSLNWSKLAYEAQVLFKGGPGSGDVAGHEFHGNQYTENGSETGDATGAAEASEATPEAPPKLASLGSARDIAKLCGYMPGSKVKFSTDRGLVYVTIHGPGYRALRTIERSGNTFVINNKELAVDSPGSGLGLKILTAQVIQAEKSGVSKLVTSAVGNPYIVRKGSDKPFVNGYYTWARLGYSNSHDVECTPKYIKPDKTDRSDAEMAEIRKTVASLASKGLVVKSGRQVFVKKGGLPKLMADPEGIKFWRHHGDSFDGEFDTRQGSDSRKVLAAYRKGQS